MGLQASKCSHEGESATPKAFSAPIEANRKFDLYRAELLLKACDEYWYGRGPFTAMEIEGPLFDRDDEPTAPSVFLSALEECPPPSSISRYCPVEHGSRHGMTTLPMLRSISDPTGSAVSCTALLNHQTRYLEACTALTSHKTSDVKAWVNKRRSAGNMPCLLHGKSAMQAVSLSATLGSAGRHYISE